MNGSFRKSLANREQIFLTIASDAATENSKSRQRSQQFMAPEAAATADDDYDQNGNMGGDRCGESDSIALPDWVQAGKSGESSWGEAMEVLEWQDDGGEYRSNNGWKGSDLVHDRQSPVRVLEYYVKYGPGITHSDETMSKTEDNTETKPAIRYKNFADGGVGTKLTGIVHFTKRAESHKGYCHGGSMCSIMDDVIGWVGFLVTGECRPWSGFTVQVNSKLQRPVHVDSILLLQATITKVERRKVSIEAIIKDPKNGNDDCVHATASGLVVVNRGVLCEE